MLCINVSSDGISFIADTVVSIRMVHFHLIKKWAWLSSYQLRIGIYLERSSSLKIIYSFNRFCILWPYIRILHRDKYRLGGKSRLKIHLPFNLTTLFWKVIYPQAKNAFGQMNFPILYWLVWVDRQEHPPLPWASSPAGSLIVVGDFLSFNAGIRTSPSWLGSLMVRWMPTKVKETRRWHHYPAVLLSFS